MIDEKVFLGLPLNFQGICQIFPPTVSEVIGNEHFAQYKLALTLSQDEINDLLFGIDRDQGKVETTLTPLEFLLNNCYYNKEYLEIVKEAFKFFTRSDIDIIWAEKKIIFQSLESLLTTINSVEELNSLPSLTEQNFFEFQNTIRLSLGEKAVERPNPNEDIRITRMKAKARYRDRIKAKKGNGLTLGTSFASICCMGLGITPLNIGQLSYAAVGALTRTYQEKEKYELDIKSLLAGADPKKLKPKYWIRNLED